MVNPEKNPSQPNFSHSHEQGAENEKQEYQPWQMTFEQFNTEYQSTMKSVAEKEKKGELDPNIQPYTPISEAEQELLETNWKEFSRQRGYSEEDIKEYERWLALSGQQDKLPNTINDPWRRIRPNWEKILYLRFIEHAQQQGFDVSPHILTEASTIKEKLQRASRHSQSGSSYKSPPSPEATDTSNDVW